MDRHLESSGVDGALPHILSDPSHPTQRPPTSPVLPYLGPKRLKRAIPGDGGRSLVHRHPDGTSVQFTKLLRANFLERSQPIKSTCLRVTMATGGASGRSVPSTLCTPSTFSPW